MEQHGYEVLRLLGCGGQGRVYEVRDRQSKLCVLKQLPWLLADDREKALREVHLLSSLRHPCIVPYLDSFPARSTPSLPTEDVLCLIMSRCEHDLRHECCQRRSQSLPFDESQIIAWLTQLCWGLQYLHARRFLHRDLKPQNVLLDASGRVFLADFGVAGHLEHTEDFKRSVVGTPAFMSPEMLEGRPYNYMTDQWALGCILFEIMSLEAPFSNCDSYAAIVMAVLHAAPVRAPGGYSTELSVIVEDLLSRKPHDRPSNAFLLRGALLREQFRDILKYSASEIQEAAGRTAATSKADADMEDAESYASDFESYSGSEAEEGGKTPRLGTSRAYSGVSIDEWRQLHVEAKALLQPLPASDPCDEVKKVWSVLCRSLGSPVLVDQALAFVRERKPLCETSEADELALQIEIVDMFGDEGLRVLPLLERCLVLESRSVTPHENSIERA